MQGSTNESVGLEFDVGLLQAARDKTLAVIEEAAKQIGPGTSELEAKKMIEEIQTRLGGPKSWHPPQIRFGTNSVLPFNQKGVENNILKENDIYFLDLGPIFDGHEGDVGRTFTLGSNPEMEKCRHDVEEIWHEVSAQWREHGASGPQLYRFAEQCAQRRGWVLSLDKANGHRVADFPHIAKSRGSIEGFEQKPAANRWILEIQIRNPESTFGAFYEDLLR